MFTGCTKGGRNLQGGWRKERSESSSGIKYIPARKAVWEKVLQELKEGGENGAKKLGDGEKVSFGGPSSPLALVHCANVGWRKWSTSPLESSPRAHTQHVMWRGWFKASTHCMRGRADFNHHVLWNLSTGEKKFKSYPFPLEFIILSPLHPLQGTASKQDWHSCVKYFINLDY